MAMNIFDFGFNQNLIRLSKTTDDDILDIIQPSQIVVGSLDLGRIQFLPDEVTGMVAKDDDDDNVFKIISGGDDVGDVILGDYDNDNGVKWDKSAGVFYVKGDIDVQTITLGTSGYIKGGQTDFNTGTGFFLGYDTDAYKFSVGNPAGSFMTWDGSILKATAIELKNGMPLIEDFEAGEDIDSTKAVCIGPGDDTNTFIISNSSPTASFIVFDDNWIAQSFKTLDPFQKIRSVTVRLGKIGGNTGNVTLAIYDLTSQSESGAPTGSPKVSKVIALGDFSTGNVEFEFASPFALSENTHYCFVISNSGNSSNQIAASYKDQQNEYADGRRFESDNAGSSWFSDANDDLISSINYILTIAGRVYLTDASFDDYRLNFIGLNSKSGTISKGSQCPVLIGGRYHKTLTSTQAGKVYYLSNVAGGIATSAGDNEKKIGVGALGDEILIFPNF